MISCYQPWYLSHDPSITLSYNHTHVSFNLQTAETQAKASLEDEKNQLEQRFTMQLSALNENLGTLRHDMAQSEVRVQDLESIEKDLRGEIAGEIPRFSHCSTQTCTCTVLIFS